MTREPTLSSPALAHSISNAGSSKYTASLALFVERIATPIGSVRVVSDENHRLRALDWEDHEARLQRLLRLHYGERTRLVDHACPVDLRARLQAYFEGDLCAIDAVGVETGGTPFQREVWRFLRTIPAGETWSYAKLAATIGRPKAVRAVGLANGSNPVGIVVPCHRVIGANSTLTGYGGGLARKRWLLRHEGAAFRDD